MIARSSEATHVHVDGVALDDRASFERETLARGVVLLLGGCVALLLHENRSASRVEGDEVTTKDDLGLLGTSAAMEALRRQIRRVARHDVPVLLLGESGSGKALVARALHALGRRASGPLVSVDIAAVSGAAAAAMFGTAQGGTLFVDEVGRATSEVQASLLRAIEARQRDAQDVRLISASDIDLVRAAEVGQFRQALLQRIGGYVIEVPPLRERREDISPLLVHFMREELVQLGREQRLLPAYDRRPWLPAWLVAAATQHDWPGNVRELRNVARQLAIDWADSCEIQHDRTVARLLGSIELPSSALAASEPAAVGRRRDRRRLEDISEAELIEALRCHTWQPAPAAAALGVSRTSLYTLMQRSPNVRKAADLDTQEITLALSSSDSIAAAAGALCVSEQGLKRQMRALGMRGNEPKETTR